jgi:opacity protein-like surface antigen
MKNAMAATLLGATAAALIASSAAMADSMTSSPTPIQGPHQTNAGKLWQSMVSAPSGGSTTTRAEATETTPGRLWTNRAQRGTRTSNVGHP